MFKILTDDRRIDVHGSQVEVNLMAGKQNILLILVGDGYLANVSLTGTPDCEFKALFKYKQLDEANDRRPLMVTALPQIRCLRLLSLELSSESSAFSLFLFDRFMLYCYLWKKRRNEEEEEVSRSTVPKQKKPVGRLPAWTEETDQDYAACPSKYTRKAICERFLQTPKL
uniref:Nucleoplasmin-like domain-containing protein n=1 Tax=Ditylenchus dipsaci TaxID=166011 RepID=A0A915E486_9BILA